MEKTLVFTFFVLTITACTTGQAESGTLPALIKGIYRHKVCLPPLMRPHRRLNKDRHRLKKSKLESWEDNCTTSTNRKRFFLWSHALQTGRWLVRKIKGILKPPQDGS